MAPVPQSDFLREECLLRWNSVPAATVPFGCVGFGLSALDTGTQFLAASSLGTEGARLPLMESMDGKLNTARVKAGT